MPADEQVNGPEASITLYSLSSQTDAPQPAQTVADSIEEDTTIYVINLPNGKQLCQPMVNTQLVQELVQVLSDRVETCHETCFALYDASNNKIDNFAELKSVAPSITVREEPYTTRHARQHVLHVNDLAKALSREDPNDGMVGNSPSAVESICSKPSSTLELPESFLMPGNEDDLTIDALYPTAERPEPCVTEISFGRWNPPPDGRRLAGDLLYVRIHTLENKVLHVTACSGGFYVNQCSDEAFSPLPLSKQNQTFHSLVSLLQSHSAQFKRKWTLLLDYKFSQSPLLRIPTPFPVFNWFRSSLPSHQADLLRSSIYCHQMGLLNEMAMSSISPIGQLRDWNEEIQITRESSREEFTVENLPAHRAAFRVHCDFVSSAARTVKGVVDGQIPAINPGEDWSLQIFIWNNLFISMAFDVRDHYKGYGGDIAAHYAAKSDFHGIERLIKSQCRSLSTVGTILADYMGCRVAVQSIVPGILEKEQEQSIAYGSADFGRSFVFNASYHDRLLAVGQKLKLKPHRIKTKLKEPECENQGAKTGEEPPTRIARAEGSREAAETEVERSAQGVRPTKPAVCNGPLGAQEHQQRDAKESAVVNGDQDRDDTLSEELSIIMPIELKGIVGNDNRHYVLDLIRMTPPDLNFLCDGERKCPHKLLSLRPEFVDNYAGEGEEFVVNLKQPWVDVLDGDDEVDRLKKFCSLIVTKAIPDTLVKLVEEEEPLDGGHLVELMHRSGVNVRYLSEVIKEFAEKPRLSYVSGIATAEIICRCAKHVFRHQSRQVLNCCSYSSYAAHFLNCFFGFGQKRQHNHRKKPGRTDPLAPISERSLWNRMRDEASLCYNFELDENCDFPQIAEKYNLARIGLLRRLCQMTGIQLFVQDGKPWLAGFTEAHISTVNPVVFHTPPMLPAKLEVMLNEAEKLFKKGDLQKCFMMGSKVHSAIVSLYGPVHQLVARCLRLLAKVNFVCNDAGEAFVLQQRATLVSERLVGLDSTQAAYDYFALAHYCFVATVDTDCQLAVKLMFRARHIALAALPLVGQKLLSHPRIMKIDANLALMLQSAGAHQLAAVFSQSLVSRASTDLNPLDKAVFYNINARVHSCLGKFKQALANERVTFTIYRKELGEEHLKTVQSEGLMKHLTEQAVLLEKNLRNTDSKQTVFVQAPSKSSVVDLMNAVNGLEVLSGFLASSKELAILRRLLTLAAPDKTSEPANLSCKT